MIFVGSPGSGKSTFFRQYLSNPDESKNQFSYKRLNNDTLKNPKKILNYFKDLITEGHSVVVDNTNATPVVREPFLSFLKEHAPEVQVRCVFLDV